MAPVFNYAPPQSGGNSGIAGSTFNYAPPTATPSPDNGLLSRVAGAAQPIVKPIESAYQGAVAGFNNTPATPKNGSFVGSGFHDFIKAGSDAFSNAIQQGADNLTKQTDILMSPSSTLLQRGVAEGNIAVGSIASVLGVALSPLQSLATVPGVGHIVDFANKLMGAIGQGAGSYGDQIIKQSTDAGVISPQTAETIRPLVHDSLALAAQIAAGKASGDALGALKDKTIGIMNTLDAQVKGAKAVVDTGPVRTVPVTAEPSTFNYSKPIEFANRYTPPEQLPTIQMGSKASETLPVEGYSPTETAAPPGYTYEPIKATEGPVAQELAPSEATVSNQTEPAPPAVNVQKTGEVTKAASDINSTLVKQGFDALSPDEQSHYTPESYKEISNNLTSAMNENLDSVKKMATGEEPLSKKLYGQGQILFKTVSQLAAKEGDVGLLTDLAKSPLGNKLSVAGQTLGESGYVGNDGSIDTVRVLRDMNEAWDTKLKNQGTDITKEEAKTEQTMKQTAKEVAIPKEVWADFAKSITCGY